MARVVVEMHLPLYEGDQVGCQIDSHLALDLFDSLLDQRLSRSSHLRVKLLSQVLQKQVGIDECGNHVSYSGLLIFSARSSTSNSRPTSLDIRYRRACSSASKSS